MNPAKKDSSDQFRQGIIHKKSDNSPGVEGTGYYQQSSSDLERLAGGSVSHQGYLFRTIRESVRNTLFSSRKSSMEDRRTSEDLYKFYSHVDDQKVYRSKTVDNNKINGPGSHYLLDSRRESLKYNTHESDDNVLAVDLIKFNKKTISWTAFGQQSSSNDAVQNDRKFTRANIKPIDVPVRPSKIRNTKEVIGPICRPEIKRHISSSPPENPTRSISNPSSQRNQQKIPTGNTIAISDSKSDLNTGRSTMTSSISQHADTPRESQHSLTDHLSRTHTQHDSSYATNSHSSESERAGGSSLSPELFQKSRALSPMEKQKIVLPVNNNQLELKDEPAADFVTGDIEKTQTPSKSPTPFDSIMSDRVCAADDQPVNSLKQSDKSILSGRSSTIPRSLSALSDKEQSPIEHASIITGNGAQTNAGYNPESHSESTTACSFSSASDKSTSKTSRQERLDQDSINSSVTPSRQADISRTASHTITAANECITDKSQIHLKSQDKSQSYPISNGGISINANTNSTSKHSQQQVSIDPSQIFTNEIHSRSLSQQTEKHSTSHISDGVELALDAQHKSMSIKPENHPKSHLSSQVSSDAELCKSKSGSQFTGSEQSVSAHDRPSLSPTSKTSFIPSQSISARGVPSDMRSKSSSVGVESTSACSRDSVRKSTSGLRSQRVRIDSKPNDPEHISIPLVQQSEPQSRIVSDTLSPDNRAKSASKQEQPQPNSSISSVSPVSPVTKSRTSRSATESQSRSIKRTTNAEPRSSSAAYSTSQSRSVSPYSGTRTPVSTGNQQIRAGDRNQSVTDTQSVSQVSLSSVANTVWSVDRDAIPTSKPVQRDIRGYSGYKSELPNKHTETPSRSTPHDDDDSPKFEKRQLSTDSIVASDASDSEKTQTNSSIIDKELSDDVHRPAQKPSLSKYLDHVEAVVADIIRSASNTSRKIQSQPSMDQSEEARKYDSPTNSASVFRPSLVKAVSLRLDGSKSASKNSKELSTYHTPTRTSSDRAPSRSSNRPDTRSGAPRELSLRKEPGRNFTPRPTVTSRHNPASAAEADVSMKTSTSSVSMATMSARMPSKAHSKSTTVTIDNQSNEQQQQRVPPGTCKICHYHSELPLSQIALVDGMEPDSEEANSNMSLTSQTISCSHRSLIDCECGPSECADHSCHRLDKAPL